MRIAACLLLLSTCALAQAQSLDSSFIPQGLHVTTVTSTSVELEWTRVPTSTTYRVWYGTEPTILEFLGETAYPRFEKTRLTDSTRYFFAVSTVVNDRESPRSLTIATETPSKAAEARAIAAAAAAAVAAAAAADSAAKAAAETATKLFANVPPADTAQQRGRVAPPIDTARRSAVTTPAADTTLRAGILAPPIDTAPAIAQATDSLSPRDTSALVASAFTPTIADSTIAFQQPGTPAPTDTTAPVRTPSSNDSISLNAVNVDSLFAFNKATAQAAAATADTTKPSTDSMAAPVTAAAPVIDSQSVAPAETSATPSVVTPPLPAVAPSPVPPIETPAAPADVVTASATPSQPVVPEATPPQSKPNNPPAVRAATPAASPKPADVAATPRVTGKQGASQPVQHLPEATDKNARIDSLMRRFAEQRDEEADSLVRAMNTEKRSPRSPRTSRGTAAGEALRDCYTVQIEAGAQLPVVQDHLSVVKDRGMDGRIEEFHTPGRTWFRLRIGCFATRGEAANMLARLGWTRRQFGTAGALVFYNDRVIR